MNINPIRNISFQGYLYRNGGCSINHILNDQVSFDVVKDSYNVEIDRRRKELEQKTRQLHALRQQKKATAEFDKFMHSDEVTQIIKRLPNNVDINANEMHDKRSYYTCPKRYYNSDAPFLYSGMIENMGAKGLAYYANCQNPDYTVNKEGIIGWLNKLVEYCNSPD